MMRLNSIKRPFILFASCVAICLVSLFFIMSGRQHQPEEARKWLDVSYQTFVETLSLSGVIQPVQTRYFTAPFSGSLVSVRFKSGERVEAGDVITEIDTAIFDAEIRMAEISLLQSQEKLQQLTLWRNSSQVLRARQAITAHQNERNRVKTEWQQAQKLLSRGIIARNEVEALEQHLQNSVRELTAAQREYQELLLQGEGQSLHMAKIEVASAQNQRDQLMALREGKRIVAPFAGIFIAINNENETDDGGIHPGNLVNRGQVLFKLLDVAQYKVVAQVAESDLARLASGQKATLTNTLFSGQPLTGTVQSISFIANASGEGDGEAMFPVTLSIDADSVTPRHALRPGMTAEIQIETYRNEQAIVVPPAAINVQNSEMTVQYRASITSLEETKSVFPGRTNQAGVEVKGITAGQIKINY